MGLFNLKSNNEKKSMSATCQKMVLSSYIILRIHRLPGIMSCLIWINAVSRLNFSKNVDAKSLIKKQSHGVWITVIEMHNF